MQPTLPDSAEQIATLDGRVYVFNEEEIKEPQPLECDFKLEELTSELKTNLKKSRFVQIKKEALRKSIDEGIGDIHDVLADAMKLIEFNLKLTTALARRVVENEDVPPDFLLDLACLSPIEDSEITLRSDFVDVHADITKTLERYSSVQKLVKDTYVADLQRYGLWG